MVVARSHMVQQIREGMDHYWSVVYSRTDDGLDATELKWKREHERDMARWEEKLWPAFDAFFKTPRTSN